MTSGVWDSYSCPGGQVLIRNVKKGEGWGVEPYFLDRPYIYSYRFSIMIYSILRTSKQNLQLNTKINAPKTISTAKKHERR